MIPNYKKYIPFQKSVLGKHWFDNCHRSLEAMLRILNDNDDYIQRNELGDKVVHRDYETFNYKSITPKYARLIKNILDYFEVKGVWVKRLNDFKEPYNTMRLYGYEKDILTAEKLITYFHSGFEEHFENQIKKYRTLKINKRRAGKNTSHSQDARTKANNQILQKVQKINDIFYKNVNPSSNGRLDKLVEIFKVIGETEKLYYRKWDTNNPQISHAICTPGKITLNRII